VIYAQQTPHLQNRVKAGMDLRYRTVGLYGNIQHWYHSTLPIKNAPVNNQRPVVCY